MNFLTTEAFEKARQFIEEKARPLEVARFRHEFGNASVDDVCHALGGYQNPDGGFGHALEADLRAPESSVLCTSIALQVLGAVGVPHNHSLQVKPLQFLRQTLDEKVLSWRIIPEVTQRSPRAPWWHTDGREQEFDRFNLNPTAEVLGYMLGKLAYVNDPVIRNVRNRVYDEIMNLQSIEMHDLLCCVRLLKTGCLPDAMQKDAQDKLVELVQSAVCIDSDGWANYSLRPLQVVDDPESSFAPMFNEAIQRNLDYEIETQSDCGAWLPNWSWDNEYKDEWLQAKQEWSGVITLEKLIVLKRFDRIKGM